MIEIRNEDYNSEFAPIPDTVIGVDSEQANNSLETLGYILTLASNDVHTIHINACGENFTELHEKAYEIYYKLWDCADTAFEMYCEDGSYIRNINNASDIVGDLWTVDIGGGSFTLETGVQAMSLVVNTVIEYISSIYNNFSSDIQSTLDEWTRFFTSQMKYFISRITQCDTHGYTESIMSASVRRKHKPICEHLDHLKLGQSYTLFCQVEDHIDDYNCDPLTIKKGDYIIRDFQFGHLPNGGNKGYIPYKVVEIEYDRDDDISGYHDKRKRLHLFDGYEDFYIDCYNDRFNGLFHKLKKSSVVEGD